MLRWCGASVALYNQGTSSRHVSLTGGVGILWAILFSMHVRCPAAVPSMYTCTLAGAAYVHVEQELACVTDANVQEEHFLAAMHICSMVHI